VTVLKKYGIIAAVIGVIAVVCSGMVASHWVFNQPKSPSLLK